MKAIFNYFILVIISLAFSFGCINENKTKKQEINNNDVQDLGLKGNVKSMKNIIYSVNYKFGEIQKGDTIQNKSYPMNYSYVFDSRGKKTAYILYNSNGTFFRKENFKYDDRGNEIEMIYERNYDIFLEGKKITKFDEMSNKIEESYYSSNGDLEERRLYFYDKKGNNIGEKKYFDDGKSVILFKNKFDDRGNEVEHISYYDDGKQQDKSIREFDDVGNKIKEIYYDSDNSKIFFNIWKYDNSGNMIENRYSEKGLPPYIRENSKYNDKGNLIERCKFKSDNSLVEKETFKYDNLENIIEEVVYDSQGLKETTIYKFDKIGNKIEAITIYPDKDETKKNVYEYDKNNNWVKLISYESIIPKRMVEREIKYY